MQGSDDHVKEHDSDWDWRLFFDWPSINLKFRVPVFSICILFQGGYKLQVLDSLERPVLDLTPVTKESDFVSTDATAQATPVQLPRDFTCQDCTIRLLRQASEWSSSYRFWSCADVDIKPSKFSVA